MSKLETFLTHVILIWVIVFSLFAERIIFILPTGGRGVVQAFEILTPFIACLLILLTNGSVISFIRKKKLVIFFLPYLALTFILPFLGVLFNDYPIRIIFGSIDAINAVSLIILGYWIGKKIKKQQSVNSVLEKYLFFAIILQFIYSLGQFLYRSGLISSIWLPFHLWDINSNIIAGLEMVYSRSSGFYLNPNILGFWAVIAIWASTVLISSKRIKIICQSASFFALIFSQSRGALIAFVISFLIAKLYILLTTKSVKHPTVTIVKVSVISAVGTYLLGSGIMEVTFLKRFQSALGVFISGSGSDETFNARVMVWKDAFAWFYRYPFGTFGSPELKFGSFIDNDWIRLFLQGGVLYLVSFLMLILGSISLVKFSSHGRFLGIVAVIIGVCALTQTPLAYSPISLFWFFVGVVAVGNLNNDVRLESENKAVSSAQ